MTGLKCTAKRRDGKPCGAWARSGKACCIAHDKASKPIIRAARRKGGKAHAAATRKPRPAVTPGDGLVGAYTVVDMVRDGLAVPDTEFLKGLPTIEQVIADFAREGRVFAADDGILWVK